MASDFTYNYYNETNKFQNLNGGADYLYDEIGNLIADHSQNISSIDWTPYGKVRQVTKGDGTTVYFRYDGAGNRIEKSTTSGGATTTTHYIRDASGNVMAMYEDDILKSQPIYGSSRLGMYKGGNKTGERNLGNKHYELSNHLGNVLAVVTDNINMENDLTTATVVSATDYYPGGSHMPGRTINSENYKYGFNGKEKDDKGEFGSTHYDYGFRIYNPEIMRFLSVDPLMKSYPMLTPYQFASNRPIDGVDLDGLEYLRADEARVKVTGGEAHINLKNFNPGIRGAWRRRDMEGNWPSGHIGWPTKVTDLDFPSIPKYPGPLNLDNTYTASDPNFVTGQIQLEGQNRSARRLNARKGAPTVSGITGGARVTGGALLALQAVNWGLEAYGAFKNNEDKRLVEEHGSILRNKVVRDLKRALETPEMIPTEYQNIQDLGSIANVVLSGVNPTDNQDIYDIGIRIVKEISKNYRPPLEMNHIDTGSELIPSDNTKVAPKVVPRF